MRIYLAVVVGSLLTVSGCGTEAPVVSSDNVDTPAQTVTVTADPDQQISKTPKPAKAPRPQVADGVDTFEMPNEVGNDLQFAQDHIQSVTDNFLFYTSSEDATGAGRMQMLDSGWVVCSQSPRPGAVFDYDTDIVFFVVKEGERCP